MEKGGICKGCSGHARTDTKTGLCLHCLATAIEVADRKAKLDGTIRGIFATKATEIRVKLRAFNSMGRTQ